jgi:methanogenic corrinoid protein MtbC1
MLIDTKTLAALIGDLEEERAVQLVEAFAAENPSKGEVEAAVVACQEGMESVGTRFESGEYFIGDLIYSGELMTGIMGILKPLILANNASKTGTIVLGTVKGDLHDIGKNIFRGMAEAAGFEVHDLGIDQPPSAFVARVKEVNPDIVGMSGLLTFALDGVRNTVKALEDAGVRDSVKLIAGGNPITPEFCNENGIDAYGGNAANGTKICLGWVKR